MDLRFRNVNGRLIVVVYFAIEVFSVFGSENWHNFSFAAFEVDVESVSSERFIDDCDVVFDSIEQVVVAVGVDEED